MIGMGWLQHFRSSSHGELGATLDRLALTIVM